MKESAGLAVPVFVADSVTPPAAVTVAPLAINASFDDGSSLIATAAPIATPLAPEPDEFELEPVFTADPSAVALPVVAFVVKSDNEPPTFITMPVGIVALAVELERLSAIAAATDTFEPLELVPSDAEAEGAAPGADVPPSVEPNEP